MSPRVLFSRETLANAIGKPSVNLNGIFRIRVNAKRMMHEAAKLRS